MKYILVTLIFTCALVNTSSGQARLLQKNVDSIHVGPGTEDVVLDTFAGRERILVSCNQRRNGLPYFGEIVAYNIKTKQLDTLKRDGGPAKPEFNPHGIDIVMGTNGKALLFVVNHYHRDEKIPKENSIIVYEVDAKSLRFKGPYTDKMLVSPNDVSGMPDGSFYATNDSKRRTMGFGWLMEKLFQVRTSTIVYCNKAHQWSIASKHKMAYANGIHADADRVLVAATQKHELARFDRDSTNGKLSYRYNITKRQRFFKGMDNITMLNSEEVLVPVHTNNLKFLGHAKDPKKLSPGIVYLKSLEGPTSIVHSNNGSSISANSVALYYNGKVYIGQVFEDFLLVVDKGANWSMP